MDEQHPTQAQGPAGTPKAAVGPRVPFGVTEVACPYCGVVGFINKKYCGDCGQALGPPAKPKKDRWDKLSCCAPIITGLCITALGALLSYRINQHQQATTEIEVLEKIVPHLVQPDENSQRYGMLLVRMMNDPRRTIRMALEHAQPGDDVSYRVAVDAIAAVLRDFKRKDGTIAAFLSGDEAVLRSAQNALATLYVNFAERKMKEIKLHYRSLVEQHRATESDQMEAVSQLDSLWKSLTAECSSSALGDAGLRCLTEREKPWNEIFQGSVKSLKPTTGPKLGQSKSK